MPKAGGAGGGLALCLLAGLAPSAGAVLQPYATGQPAAAAVGQADLVSAGSNGLSGALAAGLFSPAGVWTDGVNMAVADTGNNRVLIWNVSGVPIAPNQPADLILGQLTAGDRFPNQGGAASAVSLAGPTGVFYDGANTRLYVADRNNNRVLVYNIDLNNNVDAGGNTLTNDVPASEVLGQADFTHNVGTASAVALSSPTAVWGDATTLYVADSGNNRVVAYQLPISGPPGPAAKKVIGQANFTSGGANRGLGGVRGANTLNFPTGVSTDAGGGLYVADARNNRVLIFTLAGLPNTNASATVVVGQGDMASGSANYGGTSASSTTLSFPSAVYSDGTQLYVPDFGNHRVLLYNPIPTSNNAAAAVIVGQQTTAANSANQGFSQPTASTLKSPTDALTDGTNLYVVDLGNNRVLIYNPTPTANAAAASIPVGQGDLISGTTHQAFSTPNAGGFSHPTGVFADASHLFVTDAFNNRVLIFNSIPSASGASADVPVGQGDFVHGAPNQGLKPGVAISSGLAGPAGVFSDGTKLYVADKNNNRVLVWPAIPTTAPPAALPNVVVGQPDFNSSAPNNGNAAIGGVGAAKSLNNPSSVQVCGSSVVVADTFNNRVLIYDLPAFGNQAAAKKVLGQPGFGPANVRPNQGITVSGQTLNAPRSAYCDGANLYVADSGNNRVLIFNNFGALAAAGQHAANWVIGQPNMNTGAANTSGSQTNSTLFNPNAVFSDGTRLFIADASNHRVLIYNSIPAANGLPASLVLGQSTFTAGAGNQQGAAAAATLFLPSGLWADPTSGRLFVSDTNNNRVVLHLPTVSAPVGLTGGAATLTPASGEPVNATAQVASGVFAQNVNMFLSVPPALPVATSPVGAAKASGVGLQITLDQAVQPTSNVAVTLTYNPADMAGLDLNKLVLARYDPTNNLWLTLPSSSNPSNSRVVGYTDHFSLFQILQIDTSANGLSTVRVFPNPLLPTEGETVMNFTSLPPGARIRIYNLSGILMSDLTANAVGIAQWNGRNRYGAGAAGGVYFAVIDAGGRSRTLNIAVQR